MSIPAGDLTKLRSEPQTSKVYMIIQQAQHSTDAGVSYTGYDWSCRIDGAHTDDPTVTLTVDGGGAAADLLDGMTVLIGSFYGAWDKGIYRVRGDQTVGPATVTLDIGTSSEVRGNVADDDYVVVLDEFRFWQRYGRIEIVGDAVWYKDYDIEWDDLGGTDAARALAMMPPVPIMGPHAVKFMEIGDANAQFYFDWQDSYATAPSEAVDTWTSEGETDHAGGVWNSAVQTPGWQTVDAVSGLRGFRVMLEVDDGNGNATTLPYRRGVRYVFTLRRPGETQPGDPANAEPIVDFEMTEPIAGSFEQGFWRTSLTVFEGEAAKYDIMPGALVILFTEDVYGTTSGSLGPIDDRENILLVGRIVDGTIRENPETGDVTFEIASPGAEAAMYHNYPIVVQNDDDAATWIDTPDLTVDRAVHYYTTWHTTLNIIADLYQTGDTVEIFAQDFLEGDIYSTLNQFLNDRIFARLLCDKYGRFFCEIDANEQAFGSVTTLWTMATADWLEEITARHRHPTPVNAVECGGLIYQDGAVVPKLSHAPGLFDQYRGVRSTATSLAITSQTALNTSCGRHLSALNYEYEIGFLLAGNWRYCDIAPQRVVDIGTLSTEREALTGTYIIRTVSNEFSADAGAIFTSIQTEQEADDGVAGVTIEIPEEIPEPQRPFPKIPIDPGFPPDIGWPSPDEGRRIIATTAGVFVTDNIAATSPVWYGANNGFSTANDHHVYCIRRDPFHWWTSGGTERTLWCVNRTGVWKHENFPYGTWVQQITYAAFLAALGWAAAAPNGIEFCRMDMSIETDGRYVVGLNIAMQGGAPFFLPEMHSVQAVCQAAAILNTNDTVSAFNPAGIWHGLGTGWHAVKYDPHSATQIIYSSVSVNPLNVATAARSLYQTINGGAAWAVIDGPYGFGAMNQYGSISVPYGDGGNSVLWGSETTHRVSTDGGVTFSDVPNIAAALEAGIIGTSGIDDRIWLGCDRADGTQSQYTINSGVSWTTVPLLPSACQTYDTYTRWQGNFFKSALLVGIGTGVAPHIANVWRHSFGEASWSDKTGNLPIYSPGCVYDVERDSMGSA